MAQTIESQLLQTLRCLSLTVVAPSNLSLPFPDLECIFSFPLPPSSRGWVEVRQLKRTQGADAAQQNQHWRRLCLCTVTKERRSVPAGSDDKVDEGLKG